MEHLFLFEPWLAQPAFLLTLLAVPAAALFFLYAWLRRRRSMSQIGSSLLLRKGILLKPRMRRWKHICLLTGLFLLGMACARPQWGHDPQPQQRYGRDVVLVLDLSRSMLAEQPSRRELAIRALRHLADTFEEQGGNRVALVLFASQAKLLFPLTQDYDHLRRALDQIENNDYPSLSADEIVSGTRMGAALKLAAQTGKLERSNRPVLVLLSDGDDPVRKDEEWLQGVTEAKQQQLRIHTVGIGDPDKTHTIPHGKDRLEYEGQPIRTRLHEERLREIAARTGGTYLAAHTQTLPLGTFLQHLLDADVLREEEPPPNALPIYQQRYFWFLLPAVILFMLTMLLNEGPVSSWSWSWRFPMLLTGAAEKKTAFAPKRSALILLGALILMGAQPGHGVEPSLRLGNEAFARQDYKTAVEFYEQAETGSRDPGLIAFNKGATYYREKKYREAIECYRQCLEDEETPALRRARASFDLGNALLKETEKDVQLFPQALAAYRSCLQQPGLPTALRTDARHNLELAQLLWQKSLPPPPKKAPDNKGEDRQPAPNETVALKDQPESKGKGEEKSVDSKGESKPGSAEPQKKGKNLKSSGLVAELPDREAIRPLSKEDALATLERAAQRIAEQRRLQRHPAGPLSLSTKDW